MKEEFYFDSKSIHFPFFTFISLVKFIKNFSILNFLKNEFFQRKFFNKKSLVKFKPIDKQVKNANKYSR
jgi:hypothetical protein